MKGTQQLKEILQVVGSRHGQALFLQERFQVFLRSLLAAEANKIMHRGATSR
jgi:hypothetical protein